MEKRVTNAGRCVRRCQRQKLKIHSELQFFLPLGIFFDYALSLGWSLLVVVVVISLRSMTGDEIAANRCLSCGQLISDDNCKWKIVLFEAAALLFFYDYCDPNEMSFIRLYNT